MSQPSEILRGTGWSAVHLWGSQGAGILFFLILVYLISPEAFGLLAFAGVFLALFEIILDLGFEEALIQKEDLRKIEVDTAFWVLIGFSLVLVGAMVLLAPALAGWFNRPGLRTVLPAMSLGFIFYAFGIPARSMINRDLQFQKRAIAGVLGVVVAGVTAVYLAWQGYGVWALVVRELIQDLVENLVLVFLANWSPGLAFNLPALKELSLFGLGMIGARAGSTIRRQADDFLIGAFLGNEILGFYSVAYRAFSSLHRLVIRVLEQVALPAMARVQSDLDRLRDAFQTIVRGSSTIVFPAYGGLAVVSPILIPALLGDTWMMTGELLALIAVAGIAQGMSWPLLNLVLARGESHLRMALSWINAALNIVAFVMAIPYGVKAVALGFSLSECVFVIVCLFSGYRVLDRLTGPFLKGIYRALLSAGIMAGALVFTISFYPRVHSPIYGLLLVLEGIVIYGVLIVTLDFSFLRNIYRQSISAINGDESA